MTEFELVTWNQMYDILLSLARKIGGTGFKPDVVVGISRGGWVPARIFCDLLNARSLANIGVEFYAGINETKRRPRLTQSLSMPVIGKKVLLVDEVVDTGESLKLAKRQIIKEKADEVRTVTMYTKPWSKIEPDYHGEKSSRWIVFPWETMETLRLVMKESAYENSQELNDLEHASLDARDIRKLLNRFREEKRKDRRVSNG